MLSHITLGVTNVRRARDFYEPLLKIMELVVKLSDAKWTVWKHPAADRPLFIVTLPFNGEPSTAGNGQMVALMARSRSQVDQCYTLALAQGGTDEGRPGLRPEYHPNYYGAYFRDPDGNKLCVCCHETE